MAIVVSDTSPIRALAHLDLLALLGELFEQILLPPAVADELGRARPSVDLGRLPFASIQKPSDQSKVEEFRRSLDPGESEALALALEVKASAVLIDEAAGRRMADRLGLTPIGVLALLVRGKHRGLIETVDPLLDRLRNELGFFISEALRQEILRRSGEQ